MKWTWGLVTLSLFFSTAISAEPLTIETALQLRDVGHPRLSPDGRWIAYEVRSTDLEKDRNETNLFMIDTESSEVVQLTRHEGGDSSPRWSPDGKYLGFLSARDEEKTQVWLLDLRGGEPFAATNLPGGVQSFEWSPDSRALLLVSRDPDEEETPDKQAEDAEAKTLKPWVINRLQFKRDGVGYLKELYNHLYLWDLEKRTSTQLTSGPYDDHSPAWAPDGSRIVFVSNRTENPDANSNTDLFVVSREEGELRRLTDNPGPDHSPAWSGDGTQIAYVTSPKPELIWYATQHLAVVDVASGEEKILTQDLDRNIHGPVFHEDSPEIRFLFEDSGSVHFCSIRSDGSGFRRIVAGEREISDFHSRGEETALLISDATRPGEIFLLQAGESSPSRITRTNDNLLAEITLGEVRPIEFSSADGTPIEGFVTLPPDFDETRMYPVLLRIHGGPVAQFSHSFQEEWQVFAGQGYLVVAANPRGSSGYGEEFSRAIWANWGHKDYEDVMAAVDYVIEAGWADPERLGVGGWSYGGILTNYILVQTDRFQAAISGASETNYWSCYGTDHYQLQWEKELGLPWENLDLYLKLSPLTRVEKIVTPTLILSGEHDWNIPVTQSEQLYQSLRRLGRDTQLVVYPGQSHGIRVPSYRKDRYERYLDWYGKYLGKREEASGDAGSGD